MLGALLLNIPDFSQHGSVEAKQIAYGTTWNKEWSRQYGPEARKLKRDKKLIKKAVETLQQAEYVPDGLQDIKEVVHSRSLADELAEYKPDTDFYLVYLIEAYLFYCDWRKRRNRQVAMALILID